MGPVLTPRWEDQQHVQLIPFRPSIRFYAPLSLFFVVESMVDKLRPSRRGDQTVKYAQTPELATRIELAVYLQLLVSERLLKLYGLY